MKKQRGNEKTWKKLLSMVLIFAMCVSLMRITSLATESEKAQYDVLENEDLTGEDNTYGSNIEVDEDASDELVLYNDATKLDDGTIQLTELKTWQSGSAWYGHRSGINHKSA